MSWQEKSETPPAGYEYGSRYRISLVLLVAAAIFFVTGRRRSLARDCLLALSQLPRPPIVRGQDHIPESGSLVIAANHYERPGLWMAWPALVATRAVYERHGTDVRWVTIQQWETFSVIGLRISSSIIRRVFERFFSVYRFIPMPPKHSTHLERARAMRSAAEAVKQGDVIGLMPEGEVGLTPELLEAREGVGAFLQLLASQGARIVPVGFYEEADRLVVHFGPPVSLESAKQLPKAERDAWARDEVMGAIRDCLPEPLWGHYGPRI